MFRLLEFIRSTYLVILFIVAEVIAISHYASSSSYSRAKILAVSNNFVGGAQSLIHNTTHLFDLSDENRNLTTHIAALEARLDNYERAERADSLSAVEQVVEFDDPDHLYIVARVVSNSINKRDNFLVLNKGIEQGVRENMAVVSPTGQMLGYIAGCSAKYSAALSALSSTFSTSGKLLHGEHFGSISWNGEDRYSLRLSDLSKYANINVGDTVVSTGFSQIFPADVMIGTVRSYSLNSMQTAYTASIELAADISATDYVLIVGRRDSFEIDELINSIEEDTTQD